MGFASLNPSYDFCNRPLLRRRAFGAAQLREVVAAGEEGFDVAGCLTQALAVLDERDAHEPLAVLAEADPRRDGDIRAFEQKLREGEGADAAEFRRDRCPGEHRGGRRRHLPASLPQPVDQHIAARAVALADLRDAVLWAVER